MAEKIYSYDQNRTKEGNLVVPLDEIRTIDYGNLTIASGAWPTSGVIYAISSGQEAYIRQIMITELSGNAGSLQIADTTDSSITPPIKLVGGQYKTIDTILGPITSGFTVASGAPIAANITLVVQVDPKTVE